ncbi:MAG: PAS domain S-box protein [Nitrospirota bacterium]
MKLRDKTLLSIAAAYLVFLGFLWAASRRMLTGGFEALESRSALGRMERVLGVVDRELESLDREAARWAAWEQLAPRMCTRAGGHPSREAAAGSGLALVTCVDASGAPFFVKYAGRPGGGTKPLPRELARELPLLTVASGTGARLKPLRGSLLLAEGPLLVASHPLPAAGDPQLYRGTVVLGRLLPVQEIARRAGLPPASLAARPFPGPEGEPEFLKEERAGGKDRDVYLSPPGDGSTVGRLLLRAPGGEPVLVLRAELPFVFLPHWEKTVRYFRVSVLVVGLVSGLLLWVVLEGAIFSRLTRLSKNARAIRAGGNPSARLELSGLDEITGLTADMNEMLEALERSSDLFNRAVLSSLPVHIAVVDKRGTVIAINEAWERFASRESRSVAAHAAVGANYLDACRFASVWGPRPDGDIAARVEDVLAGRREHFACEYRSETPEGRRWFMLGASPLRAKRGGAVISHIDITDRKEAEEELARHRNNLEDLVRERTQELTASTECLRESEEKFRILAEQSPNMIFIIGMGRVLYTNRKSEELLGFSRREAYAPHFNYLRVVAPESVEVASRALQSHLRGQEVEPGEYTLLASDGRRVETIISSRSIRLQGEPAVLGVVTDITEWKRTERELEDHRVRLEELVAERTLELEAANEQLHRDVLRRRRAEEQLRLVTDALPALIAYVDGGERYQFVNKACQTWGYRRPGEALGRHMREVMGEEDYAALRPHIERALAGEEAFYEGTLSPGEETPRHVHAVFIPHRGEEGEAKGFFCLVSDVTEKVRLQAEALRAAHLASLGELAAGVAHEINNPVNAIMNYAQLVLDEHGGEKDVSDIAGRILNQGSRIAFIIRSLLSFAREQKEEKSLVPVSGILMDTLAVSEAQLKKHNVALSVEMPDDLPPVLVHPQRIQQVFLNIINNARYALNLKYPGQDPGKALAIRGRTVLREDRSLVEVAFLDQGPGIPPSVREKVMNPFFTTKPQGQGTGLGLSISHGIIADLGGRLRIESEEGRYTRVVVELPAGGNS